MENAKQNEAKKEKSGLNSLYPMLGVLLFVALILAPSDWSTNQKWQGKILGMLTIGVIIFLYNFFKGKK